MRYSALKYKRETGLLQTLGFLNVEKGDSQPDWTLDPLLNHTVLE
jgi:hypothetical protein